MNSRLLWSTFTLELVKILPLPFSLSIFPLTLVPNSFFSFPGKTANKSVTTTPTTTSHSHPVTISHSTVQTPLPSSLFSRIFIIILVISFFFFNCFFLPQRTTQSTYNSRHRRPRRLRTRFYRAINSNHFSFHFANLLTSIIINLPSFPSFSRLLISFFSL